MYDRLLVPTDGSDAATAALEHALDVAATDGAAVHVLYVADTTRDSVFQIRGQVQDVLEDAGEEVVADARDLAADRGVEVVDEVLQGDPRETILTYADAHDVDLIVMGTHGRSGVDRFLLGSVTERVVREAPAPVPVLTVRADDEVTPRYPYESILVPIDGSACADEAVALGSETATRHDATVHLLSVVDVAAIGVDVRADYMAEQLTASATELVDETAATVTDAGVDDVVTAVEHGSAHRTIRSYADTHDVDLIVMGTHGRSGVDRYLLGSVTERVVRTAPAPVLTTRERDEE